jgi:hypothetical protein
VGYRAGYLLRDRDRIFGNDFVEQVKAMGIKEVLSAPRSPWQRAYVERVIGTIRRECLDHVIVFNQATLYQHLKAFAAYYHESRTHSRSTRTPQRRDPFSRPRWDALLPFRSLAVFTTGTSDAQPERSSPAAFVSGDRAPRYQQPIAHQVSRDFSIFPAKPRTSLRSTVGVYSAASGQMGLIGFAAPTGVVEAMV